MTIFASMQRSGRAFENEWQISGHKRHRHASFRDTLATAFRSSRKCRTVSVTSAVIFLYCLQPVMNVAPGTQVGCYEIRAVIGKGGMGEVWRAHDTRLDRDVAIKFLSDPL